MRIPITKYGLPQVVVYPVIVLAVMVGVLLVLKGRMPAWGVVVIELLLLAVLLWILSFFRDPQRQAPDGTNILLSPADGVVSDIATVDDQAFVGGKALRIGIFLNIFNVHINRMPCAVRVESVTYKKGRFINAMNADSGRVNESNDIYLTRLAEPFDRLLVRQISGAIARRIVCQAQVGEEFTAGEKFGMIKFGSRTELYLPIRDEATCLVKVGEKVKAGLTVLVRYE
ncbi:MAG: phosphatidylserine decarboxylase family protein [Planctomycetes bacterium]|nr:phosphatidylserine decarboxylase family protein [Planctomycetota bacterium]